MKNKPTLSSKLASFIIIFAACISLAILAINNPDELFTRVRYVPSSNGLKPAFSNEFLYASFVTHSDSVIFEGSNGTDNVPFQYGNYSGRVCFGEHGDSIHWINVPTNFNYDFADYYVWDKYDQLISSL